MAALRNNHAMPKMATRKQRRIGRPPKAAGEHLDHMVSLLLTHDQAKALRELQAQQGHVGESTTARLLIVAALKTAGLLTADGKLVKDPPPPNTP